MKKRPTIENGYGNVFRDIGFAPGQAHNLLRAEMMMRIEEFFRESTIRSRRRRVLGVTQPRLNQLLKRRIELFSLDALVKYADQGGHVRGAESEAGCLGLLARGRKKVFELHDIG